MLREKYNRASPYGSDIRGSFDIDPTLSLASGLEVAQNDVLKRLTTPRGSLFWAPNEGLSLVDYANMPLDSVSRTLARDIEVELAKDPRVLESHARTLLNARLEKLEVNVQVTFVTGETFEIVGDIAAGYEPKFRRAG